MKGCTLICGISKKAFPAGNCNLKKWAENENGINVLILPFQSILYDKHNNSYLLAEGLIDGKVVATHKVMPTRRPSKLILWADNENMNLEANGSDLVTVVAAVADDKDNIKRLNNYHIKFDIEGNGKLVADNATFTNPRQVQWGTAPVLVRANTNAGEIKIKASVVFEGIHTPLSAELIIKTIDSKHRIIADKDELSLLLEGNKMINKSISEGKSNCEEEIKKLQQELSRLKLKEVEKQQSDFE